MHGMKEEEMTKTHVKTGPIVMGLAHLYEPYVYKGKDKEKSEDDKDKPKFNVNVALDKETQMPLIRKLLAAQEAAMDEENWKSPTKAAASRALVDADDAEVAESPGSTKLVLLSEKRPKLKGCYSMSAKVNAPRRPYVRYFDEDGVIRVLPDPILDPDPDDPEEMAEAERIKRLWDKWVYEGQIAELSITFRTYAVGTNRGVSARLNGVLIFGGGERPAGHMTTFEEDYSPEELEAWGEWVKAHRNGGSDDGDSEDVDDETGEITPARSRKPKPASKPRRRKPVEVVEPDEADEDDEVEDVPVAPRRSRKSKRAVVAEDSGDDEFEDDDLF